MFFCYCFLLELNSEFYAYLDKPLRRIPISALFRRLSQFQPHKRVFNTHVSVTVPIPLNVFSDVVFLCLRYLLNLLTLLKSVGSMHLNLPLDFLPCVVYINLLSHEE